MMTRIGTTAIVVLAAFVLPTAASARRTHQPGDGVPDSIHYYETVAMMSSADALSSQAAAPSSVKTAELSFYTLGRQFDLKLEAHDPFAPGAMVHWVDDTGEVVEPADSGGTVYRGRVEGDPASWVRITMRGNALAGVIATGDELYFLEPAERFFGNVGSSETLAYRLSDTESEWTKGSCATKGRVRRTHQAIAQARSVRSAMQQVLGPGAAAAVAANSTLKRAQIGMVADFLYFNKHGADSATDITELINNVDGIYQSQLGVTLDVISIVVFSTQASDPFSTSTDPNTILSSFSNWKAANDNSPSQSMWNTDIAHLITGRDLNSNVIGIAYIGALCDPTFGVGVDQDFTNVISTLTLLPAHEMGHNFGAFHDAQANPSCPCCAGSPPTYIMNPSLGPSNQPLFSDCTKSFINPDVSAASCLDTVNVTPPPPPTLDPLASPIVVGSPLTLTGTGFSAGSVINIFVAMAGGVAAHGPYAPSSRTSTTLTFNQVDVTLPPGNGFATIVVINTDQNFQTSNAQSQYIFGNSSLGMPNITAINGFNLRAFDATVPVANVETAVTQGSTVTITGSGFNAGALVNLFSAAGPIGPLTPLAGGTSTTLQVQIPANAPTGPGAFQVVNSPYTGPVISNAVSVPIGAPLTISSVAQNGSTIDVHGTGFSVVSVINFFNAQPGGAVLNLGGYGGNGQPNIPLNVVSDTEFTFAVPAGAASGKSYVQVINPPYIPFSSTGADPHGGFTLVVP